MPAAANTNNMQTLTVALGDRSYPIHIGRDLLTKTELILPHLQRKQVAVVSNTTVAPLYLEQLAQPLRDAGVSVIDIVLPDGEAYKNGDTLNLIYDALLANRCERAVHQPHRRPPAPRRLLDHGPAQPERFVNAQPVQVQCYRNTIVVQSRSGHGGA